MSGGLADERLCIRWSLKICLMSTVWQITKKSYKAGFCHACYMSLAREVRMVPWRRLDM